MDQVDGLVSCALEISNRKIQGMEYARHRREMGKGLIGTETD